MIPQTISEQLMFTTTKLSSSEGSGTGFFFDFLVDGVPIPVVITNKHVVNYSPDEFMTFEFHTHVNGEPVQESVRIKAQTKWHFHNDHDLCFTFLMPIVKLVKDQLGKDVFVLRLAEDLIWDSVKLLELSAIEDTIMVGYPNGLYDSVNNFPLFRRGITASHPALDFNRKGIGAVDMACFPGSSGSPIFILNEGSYQDKKGSLHVGQSRMVFLGILFEGPIMTANGKIEIVTIPTAIDKVVKTDLMINLGYYVKAEELLKFKDLVARVYRGN